MAVIDKFKVGASRANPTKRDVPIKDGATTASSVRSGGTGLPSDYLILNDGDVIRNYKWGVHSSSQEGLDEIPSMILTEFQTTNGPMQDDLLYAGRLILGKEIVAGNYGEGIKKIVSKLGEVTKSLGEGAVDALLFDPSSAWEHMQDAGKQLVASDTYVPMYTGKFTENVFIVPYFSAINRSIANSWAENDKSAFGGGLDILSKISSVVGNSYSTITKRQMFTSTNNGNIETSFQLFNTLSNDPISTILQNFNFIRVLQHNNMAGKTTAFNMVPPVIYEVNIPGIRYAPAAYISNLVVESIGQVNNVRLPVTIGNSGFLELNDLDINVPDAWNITIQLTELLPETRNIFAGVFNSANKIRVITGEGRKLPDTRKYFREP